MFSDNSITCGCKLASSLVDLNTQGLADFDKFKVFGLAQRKEILYE